MESKKKPASRDALMVRIPAALVRDVDEECARYFRDANLSRVQIVSLALREWLEMRKAQREVKTKTKK